MNVAGAVEVFASFKAEQRELWAGFAVNEGLTTPAAELVGLLG